MYHAYNSPWETSIDIIFLIFFLIKKNIVFLVKLESLSIAKPKDNLLNEIFANDISNKELISKIKSSQNSISKKNS